MTIYLTESTTYSEAFVLDEPSKSVVILGNLNFDTDVTLKVNNLVIFGKIICSGFLTVHCQGDFISLGKIHGKKDINIIAEEKIATGAHIETLARINSLEIGVRVVETSTGIRVIIPE